MPSESRRVDSAPAHSCEIPRIAGAAACPVLAPSLTATPYRTSASWRACTCCPPASCDRGQTQRRTGWGWPAERAVIDGFLDATWIINCDELRLFHICDLALRHSPSTKHIRFEMRSAPCAVASQFIRLLMIIYGGP